MDTSQWNLARSLSCFLFIFLSLVSFALFWKSALGVFFCVFTSLLCISCPGWSLSSPVLVTSSLWAQSVRLCQVVFFSFRSGIICCFSYTLVQASCLTLGLNKGSFKITASYWSLKHTVHPKPIKSLGNHRVSYLIHLHLHHWLKKQTQVWQLT